MKKNHIVIIILSIVIIILLVLCAVFYIKSEYLEEHNENYNSSVSENNNLNNKDSNSNISSDEALQIALESLNINKDNIYDLDNELDYKYGTDVYEIGFKYDGYEYDFYINAKTGEIIKSFKERD